MPLIEKRQRDWPGTTESYLINVKTEERFNRVVGGIAWPGKNPGFIVIVAEDYKEDKISKKRHYRILAEYESQSLIDLSKRGAEFSANLCAYPFYGDVKERWAMEILKKSGTYPYITAAPFVDDPAAFKGYMHNIRQLTDQTTKRLHFGSKSLLPDRLAALIPDDMMTTAKVAFEQHPAITALGYAVCALEAYSYDRGQQALVDRLNAELAELYDD
jgi:hypothetical protein